MSMLSRFATTGGGIDPYWANVSYLLVGNGANGTTTNIVDSSSNNIATTVEGSTVISTAQSKYGGSSVYFNGIRPVSVDSASSPVLSFGTGSFTIEMWFYEVAKPAYFTRLINFNADYAINTHAIIIEGGDQTSRLRYAVPGNMGDAVMMSTSSIAYNTWYYVAITRSGSSFSMYVNGVREATYTNSGTVDSNTSSYITLGDTRGKTGSEVYQGYMYDVRLTKGVARYTGSTMTVPTAPLPIG